MKKKKYLIPENSPEIAAYRDTFELFSNQETKSLTLKVPPGIVDEMEVGMLQQLILVSEHYPQVIEKLLFAINLQFEQIEGSELFIHELDWKKDRSYYRWFRKLNNLPFLFCFLEDHDSRLYALAGDFLADGKVNVKHVPGEKQSTLEFSGQPLQILFNRIFGGCTLLMHFCTHCEFDVLPYIEALLADFDTPFDAKEVKKRFDKEVKKGYEFRAGPE